MELVNKTIGQYLHEQAERYGNHTAIEVKDWSCTYQQLDMITDSLAIYLEKLEITRGAHVGIWSENSPVWVFLFLSLVKMGAVPVLINSSYKQKELEWVLHYSDVEVLFYGRGYKGVVYEDIICLIKDHDLKVRHFIPIEEDLTKLMFLCSGLQTNLKMKQEPLSHEPACIIFTSGTSSYPKGVVLNHYQLVNNALEMASAMRWTYEDKMCIALPLFHCFGITAGIIACIVSGMSMYLLPYFSVRKVWEAIESEQCTVLNGVPSVYLALIRKEGYRYKCSEQLRSGILAGSSIRKEEYFEICEHFRGIHLQPAYGQTETSPCVSMADWNESWEMKAISAGKVLNNIKVRIVSPDLGQTVNVNECGEIQVKGYNVMTGYYKCPEANQSAFTRDGWLRTGDLGRFDSEGRLYIIGRLKEVIIRGGENISPSEIEAEIQKLEWVRHVKVIGVPAEIMQEEIAACITIKDGCRYSAQELEKELKEYLKPRLAGFKIPSKVMILDEFPMTASRKIDLKKLKEMAAGGGL